ncbi:hypothetical protein DENSPDRAFT_843806 [Dentipellis sp. KUC8613]|nr:hypothetical protein DENSPDRAFT_843806 [Dentipellis sp. KUC8613]
MSPGSSTDTSCETLGYCRPTLMLHIRMLSHSPTATSANQSGGHRLIDNATLTPIT